MSYRNLMVYRGRPGEEPFTDETVTDPPHDHPGEPAASHLPRGPGAELLKELMSRGVADACEPPGQSSADQGWKVACECDLAVGAGEGAERSPSSLELHRLKGAIISAVDLVRGVGQLAGWTRIDVPGATGYLDTDYAAKGRYAIEALADHDIVCVHVEAPDEASHEGRHEAKVEALERIDQDIVGPVLRCSGRV